MEEDKSIPPTKFQSPVPFLIQFRNLLFGKEKPDILTRVVFHINLVIWTTFFLWNAISFFTITSRDLILEQKGISVEAIIFARGEKLGYEGAEFLDRLVTFHSIAMICWALVLVGLILFYRKNKRFIYFILGGVSFYIGMMLFYIGFTYFLEDTTTYDKIALLVLLLSAVLHYYLLGNTEQDGSLRFFNLDEEDE